MSLVLDLYPRSLSAWLKADDKMLLNAVVGGQSVLEVAEDLQRDHILVINRCCELGLYDFSAGSEEWAEFMGLALAGVPLQVVIDWCSGSPSRLLACDIEAMAMGDLRNEFYLAQQLGIVVANSGAVADLSWLASQPDTVKAGYLTAAQRVSDCFDMLTPATLKSQVLGLTPPPFEWTGDFPQLRSQLGSWRFAKAGKSRKTSAAAPVYANGYAKPAKKRYRRRTATSTVGTRTVKAKTGHTYTAYKKSKKSSGVRHAS